jgi:hypothetical protein
MTHDEWLDQYKPTQNHLVQPDERPFNNMMFETYGDEWTHVVQYLEQYVWTVIEVDGDWWLSPGRHVVNRIGYFVTDIPFDTSNPPEDISLED